MAPTANIREITRRFASSAAAISGAVHSSESIIREIAADGQENLSTRIAQLQANGIKIRAMFNKLDMYDSGLGRWFEDVRLDVIEDNVDRLIDKFYRASSRLWELRNKMVGDHGMSLFKALGSQATDLGLDGSESATRAIIILFKELKDRADAVVKTVTMMNRFLNAIVDVVNRERDF